jgi:hypothetical protein
MVKGVAMTDPAFQISRIVYFTDMTRADAPAIPLGVLAEISTGKMHGLALKARTSLFAEERDKVTPLLREAMADPFAYFKKQFDEAWKSSPPGKALGYFTRLHTSSLSVLAPTDCEEKQWLLERLIHPRSDAIEAKLIAAVNKAFDRLEADFGTKDIPQKIILESERRAA